MHSSLKPKRRSKGKYVERIVHNLLTGLTGYKVAKYVHSNDNRNCSQARDFKENFQGEHFTYTTYLLLLPPTYDKTPILYDDFQVGSRASHLFHDDLLTSQFYCTDFSILFTPNQSYMYCFSRKGHLRMVEHTQQQNFFNAKHLNLCPLFLEINKSDISCAGVFLELNGRIHVDILSGTYRPTFEHLKSFKKTLQHCFPFTMFTFKFDDLFLKQTDFQHHPDYR